MSVSNQTRRKKIHRGIRSKISGTAELPRFSVFRSNKSIYAQLIDDISGKTLVAASSVSLGDASGTKTEISSLVGMEIAKKAKDLGIVKVVFDRSGYRYHGRLKALANGAREGGLVF